MHPTGNANFDAAALAAEGARQVALASAQSQADVTAADLAYYGSLLAAAASNGIATGQFATALAEIRRRTV